MRYIIAACLLFCNLGFAAEEAAILIISDSGYAWMIQDSQGNPVLYKFSQVIVLGKKPPVIQPPVATEFGLEAQVKQWLLTVVESAIANKKEIAAGLKEVAEEAEADEYKTIGEMEASLGVTIKSVIKEPKEWRAFGSALYASLETLKATGKVKTPKDMARALKEVVKGLQ